MGFYVIAGDMLVVLATMPWFTYVGDQIQKCVCPLTEKFAFYGVIFYANLVVRNKIREVKCFQLLVVAIRSWNWLHETDCMKMTAWTLKCNYSISCFRHIMYGVLNCFNFLNIEYFFCIYNTSSKTKSTRIQI